MHIVAKTVISTVNVIRTLDTLLPLCIKLLQLECTAHSVFSVILTKKVKDGL